MSLADAARGVAAGAQQHVQTYRPQQQSVQPDAGATPTPNDQNFWGDGGTTAPDPQIEAAKARYMQGAATPADLSLLLNNGDITLQQAQAETARMDAATAKQNAPSAVSGLYPFNPQNDMVSAYQAQGPIGSTAVEAGGPANTFADPQTGVLYNAKGAALPQYLQKFLGGIGGGGGAGYVDHGPTQQEQITNAMNWQQLLNQQKQQQLTDVLNTISAIRAQQTLQMNAQQGANTQLMNAGPNLVGTNQFYGGWAPGGPGPALASLNGLSMGAVPTAGHVVNLNIDPNPPPPDPALQALLARIGGQ